MPIGKDIKSYKSSLDFAKQKRLERQQMDYSYKRAVQQKDPIAILMKETGLSETEIIKRLLEENYDTK